MKTIPEIALYGANYAGVTRHCREASRGVVVRDGQLLLSHETKINQWMLPGGGLEPGETPQDCCAREVAEETGLVVIPGACFLILREYYEDWEFVSYYYPCQVVGQTERNPTKREIEVGARPEWLSMDAALALFSHHQDYAETNEERRGIYLREYRALSAFLEVPANQEPQGNTPLALYQEVILQEAQPEDASVLVELYNASFYADYLRYGYCPGYGRTVAEMEASIRKVPKFLIVLGGKPVGVISCGEISPDVYEIGCLCVIPPYQRKGIGTKAMQSLLSRCPNWKQFTLVTPADKEENVRFYTEKCGFRVISTEMDGDMKVYRFLRERG